MATALTALATLGLGRIQLGLAQLAVAVGVDALEPRFAARLGHRFAVGLVDEAVLVHVHPLEVAGSRRQGLGLADAAVLVGIGTRAGEAEATEAVAAAATMAAWVLHARQFVALQLAVLVAVQLVEALGQARMRRGLGTIDYAVLVGVQRHARLGLGGGGRGVLGHGGPGGDGQQRGGDQVRGLVHVFVSR